MIEKQIAAELGRSKGKSQIERIVDWKILLCMVVLDPFWIPTSVTEHMKGGCKERVLVPGHAVKWIRNTMVQNPD